MKEKNSYIAFEVNFEKPGEKARKVVLTGGKPMTKEVFIEFLQAAKDFSEDEEIRLYQKYRRLYEARNKK